MCSEDGFEEYLCDVVASELLMPTEAFTNVLEGRTAGWSEAWKIANTFGVSFHAAVGRIQKLDLWPCVLVIVQPIGERGTHPQFKLDTYYSSESLGRDAIGVGVLAGKVVDFLNARGDEVLTTGHSYELDSRLPTSLSIQGQYFKIADNQLGRVLVFKTPRPGSSKEASKTFKTALMSTRLEQLQLEEL